MENGLVDLRSRRELFVDYELIDRLLRARLKLHEPRPAEVAIRLDRPWEGPFNGGGCVFEYEGSYRIYYRGRLRAVQSRTCRLRLSRVASDHLPVVADFELY